MTVTISTQFDCTQREFVAYIAALIYKTHGGSVSHLPMDYLFESEHPTERGSVETAELIFELLTGDTPDYSDDPDEDDMTVGQTLLDRIPTQAIDCVVSKPGDTNHK